MQTMLRILERAGGYQPPLCIFHPPLSTAAGTTVPQITSNAHSVFPRVQGWNLRYRLPL